MANIDLFYKDLSTFSKKDLHTLFRYYHVSSISQLIPKITKNKASLPFGTVFDAITNNNFNDFMEFLNDPNFDPNIMDSRGRPILVSCVFNTKKIGTKYVIELLKKHPNINFQNNKGYTALMLLLLYSGTKSEFGSTEETVKILVDAGINLNIQNNKGETALILASQYSDEKVIKMLVDGPPGGPGADVNLQNNDGDTALMLVFTVLGLPLEDIEKRIKVLVDAGSNVNIQNKKGKTALMFSLRTIDIGMVFSFDSSSSPVPVSSEALNIIQIVLNGPPKGPKADVNIKDNDGETAIEMDNNIEVQLLLLDYGAKLTDNYKLKDLINMKIAEIRNELDKYKNKLNNLELNLLKCDEEHKKSGVEELNNLKECVKKAKELNKYKPGGKEALKIKEKYNKHQYFNKK